jgi:hypothetical protein
MMITEWREAWEDNCCREAIMPILMVALMALVAFGLIGVLLFTAGSLERHNEKKTVPVTGIKPTH